MVKPSIHRQSIIDLHQRGVSARSIQNRLGVPRRTVFDTIARFKQLGTNKDRFGRGRKRSVVTKAAVKRVRERIRRNPERSVRRMSREMTISEPSMRRIVRKELKMKAFKKNKCQGLTNASKQKRMTRCRDLLQRFPGRQHHNILFTDEKLFTVEQVLNKQNDRVYAISNPHKTVKHVSHPASLMVWAGITADGKTPLVFVPAGVKINGNEYLNILKTRVLPWAQSHFGRRQWIFQQDGAPAHKARFVQDWCAQNFPDFIAFNEWPPSSPDLNPMDYSVWSVLEAKACEKPHKNIDSLKKALIKAWDDLDVSYLRATVDSFTARLDACHKANGDIFEV